MTDTQDSFESYGDVRLPFGVLPDGRFVSVRDVSRGLACGCVCAQCGSELVARKGSIYVHHFAHASTEVCSGAAETTLHKLAKKILAEDRRLLFPAAEARVAGLGMDIFAAREFVADEIFIEAPRGVIRPDAIFMSKGRSVAIEFCVTHEVSPEKVETLRRMRLPCVEIFLGAFRYTSDMDEVRRLVLKEARRKWAYHPKIDEAVADLTEKAAVLRAEMVERAEAAARQRQASMAIAAEASRNRAELEQLRREENDRRDSERQREQFRIARDEAERLRMAAERNDIRLKTERFRAYGEKRTTDRDWRERLVALANKLLGAERADAFLAAPTITCEYSVMEFPDLPTDGEIAAFDYELRFAAQMMKTNAIVEGASV